MFLKPCRQCSAEMRAASLCPLSAASLNILCPYNWRVAGRGSSGIQQAVNEDEKAFKRSYGSINLVK